ncbi:MAG: hypothetical protein GX879_02105 [Bacteroidales bacterium]|nr:hypothetical protein [Bacteroidales bacterium]
MKSIEELQKDYEKYLEYVRQDKSTFWYEKLEKHSMEDLQQLINFGYIGEDGEELFKILLGCRKKKANEQFIYNQENINKILQIDQDLKAGCKQLKIETEKELYQLLERINIDDKFLAEISGFLRLNLGDPVLENAFSFHENTLSYSVILHTLDAYKRVLNSSLLNLETNYADKISVKTFI